MKKKVKVLLIALAAIVFVVGDVQATSLYVDNASASSGNGQSWAIVNVSGTVGNPITITVDAANANHNGTVVFDYDAQGDNANTDGIFFTNNSYIVFSGNVNGQNHIAFKNLRNIIDCWVNHAIVGYNNTGIIFEHLDITNCNNGISVSLTGTGNEIQYSNSTDSIATPPVRATK